MKTSFLKFRKHCRNKPQTYQLETGFSMLEAVVVVGVLLALAVGGFFAYGPITENAKIAKVRSAASEIHTGVLVASMDGNSDTSPENVIADWNSHTDKIRVALVDSQGGNGDFCVSATNVASPHITHQTGACVPGSGGGGPTGPDNDNDGIPDATDPDNDNDGIPNDSDPTPNGENVASPGSTNPILPVSMDFDGDRIGNAFDTSPRGETNQYLVGFGANWASELGTTYDTLSTTGYIMQGPLAGQRIGLLSENTGSYHACGTLESSGELYCWGSNAEGAIGNGARGGYATEPVKVSGLDGKSVSQVITNGYNTCAIADGAPYCWGNYSLIGDDYVLTATAVDTGGVLSGKLITKLIGGNQFACVMADGVPYCWGANQAGELGIGTSGYANRSYTPVAVNTSGVLAGKTITDLGASNGGPCAIADGAAFCWGRGDAGTMGNGTRTSVNPLPVAVTGLAGKTVTTIAGGYSNICAVADGAAYCWGQNSGDYSNMLGDGIQHPYSFVAPYDANYQMVPQAVDASGVLAGKTVTHVDMGDSHVCVIANETPYCWGEWESTDPGSDAYGYVETFSPVAVGGSHAAGNRTVGLWTTAGSTIFSYITTG